MQTSQENLGSGHRQRTDHPKKLVKKEGEEEIVELPSEFLEEEPEVPLPRERINGVDVTYAEAADDFQKQQKFWESRLALRRVGEIPPQAIAYETSKSPALNDYFVIYHPNQSYQHFRPNDRHPAVRTAVEAQRALETIYTAAKAKSPDMQKLVNKDRDLLLSQYKIHLQPKKEYIPIVIDRIIQLLEKNPELGDVLAGFKARLGSSEKAGKDGGYEQMAEIVIYPAAGAEKDADGKTVGRKNLEIVLAAIVESCADLEGISNGVAPRENAKITDLIYVAQSDGNLKTHLKEAGLIDQYFQKDAEGTYAFANGEKPPTLQEIQQLGKKLAQKKQEQRAAQHAMQEELRRNAATQQLHDVYAQPKIPQEPTGASLPPALPDPPKKPGFFARLFGRN